MRVETTLDKPSFQADMKEDQTLAKQKSAWNNLINEKPVVFLLATLLLAGLVGGLAGMATGSLFSESGSDYSSATAIDRILPSVVTIRARFEVGVADSKSMQQRVGCGVVYKDAYVITNAHIVSGAKEIYVKPQNKKETSAELIGARDENDIAVLKIEQSGLEVPRFVSSRELKVGEPVLAIGKPFVTSNKYTVTSGVISSLPVDLPKGSPTLLQTDAAINPGNSGGPLCNQEGQVVAINTAYLTTGESAQGIGFAIPIGTARKIADEIIGK